MSRLDVLSLKDLGLCGQSLVDSVSLVSDVQYSPLKQIARIDYASGIITQNTFNPGQAYRLTHKTTVNAFDEVIQDIAYVYDNVGNIIRLVDSSDTLLAKTTDYEYDDLHRLSRATVTDSANNADYQQTYSYDPIGNILEKSDVGQYQYQNLNPYQASSIAGADYAYDVNGNLTSDTDKSYTYNYADRLLSVNMGDGSVLYNNYDQSGQRTVKQLNRTVPNTQGGESVLSAKTAYPNSLYEEEQSGLEGDEEGWQVKKIRHITLGNQTIAHFTLNTGAETEKALVFSDHLGSASLLTDTFGRPKMLYDYYPFGSSRMEQQLDNVQVAGTQYQYTGKELDRESGLNYYGARYYEAATGRFTQSDPLSLYLSNVKELKDKTGKGLMEILSHPFALNAYAYSGNNPIVYSDPNGEWRINFFALFSQKTQVAIGNWANRAYNNHSLAKYAMDHPYQTGIAAGLAAGAITAGIVVGTGGAITCGILCGGGAAAVAGAGEVAVTQEDKVEKVVGQGTKLLNGPINTTVRALNHVLDEHTTGGSNTAGNSIFNANENVFNLIKQGTQQVIEKQSFGSNFQRVFDVGRNIGIDRLTNKATSIMTIITNKAGDLVTAFPGRPNF